MAVYVRHDRLIVPFIEGYNNGRGHLVLYLGNTTIHTPRVPCNYCYTRCIRRVCQKTNKTKVTCGIFHAIPQETAAQLFYNTTWKIQWLIVSMQRAIGRLGVIPSRIQRLSCILIVACNENGYRRNGGISLEVDTYSTQGRRDIHSRIMLQTPKMSNILENSLLSFCGHSNSVTC